MRKKLGKKNVAQKKKGNDKKVSNILTIYGMILEGCCIGDLSREKWDKEYLQQNLREYKK